MALLIDGNVYVSKAKAAPKPAASTTKSWEKAYAAADAGSLGVTPKKTVPSSSPGTTSSGGATTLKTDTDIRAFQAANGLTIDGIIGPQTRAALEKTNGPSQSPIAALNQTIDNPLDDLPSPPSPGSPPVPGSPNSPGTPGIPGIVLPDGNLEPVSSPVVENPDHRLSHWDNGYVDTNGTYVEDGQLHLPEIYTRGNSLFSELDLGSYGTDDVELPRAAIHFFDASDGGSAIRWDIGPEASIPIAGADTSINDNGDKVLEVFIPTPGSSVTLQSDDPVGAVVSPFTDVFGLAGGPIGTAADVAGEYFDRTNFTNTVTGGRWDPPTERLTGLTAALNPDKD